MEKRRKMFVILVLAAALFIGCGRADAQEMQESVSASDTAGERDEALPETEASSWEISFEGTDMEGNTVTSGIFSQAKLTMVNVWATYCNPCLREMPGLGELAEKYDPEEFQIIGIINDVMEGGDQELAESLIEQTDAGYTHLLLNKSLYDSLLTEVSAVPTTFFVDQNGSILDTVVGAMEKSAWEEKINALLEEL